MKKRPVYRGSSRRYDHRSQHKKRESYRQAVFQVQVFACVCMLMGAVYIKHTDSAYGQKVRETISRSLEVSTNAEALQAFWEDLQEAKRQAVAVFAPAEPSEQQPEETIDQEPAELDGLVHSISYYEPLLYRDYDTGLQRDEIPSRAEQDERQKMQAPILGIITSGYGKRIHPITGEESFHYGVDVAPADEQQYAICAAASGTVEKTGSDDVSGNYLLVRHEDGLLTFYAHCSQLLASEGQTVEQGEVIARVGSTGRSTGDHLHFEIRGEGKIYDPLEFVSFAVQ